jgi:hypothetical protein
MVSWWFYGLTGLIGAPVRNRKIAGTDARRFARVIDGFKENCFSSWLMTHDCEAKPPIVKMNIGLWEVLFVKAKG